MSAAGRLGSAARRHRSNRGDLVEGELVGLLPGGSGSGSVPESMLGAPSSGAVGPGKSALVMSSRSQSVEDADALEGAADRFAEGAAGGWLGALREGVLAAEAALADAAEQAHA